MSELTQTWVHCFNDLSSLQQETGEMNIHPAFLAPRPQKLLCGGLSSMACEQYPCHHLLRIVSTYVRWHLRHENSLSSITSALSRATTSSCHTFAMYYYRTVASVDHNAMELRVDMRVIDECIRESIALDATECQGGGRHSRSAR